MGILEDKSMEHVPGTTRYFDDPERPQAATADTTGLKCDTSGPVPIILVPQPSDDPNDPLVGHIIPNLKRMSDSINTELAIMETRPHPPHTLNRLDFRNMSGSYTRSEHLNIISLFRAQIHEDRSTYRLFLDGRWSCWHTVCAICKDMGKEASFSAGDNYTGGYKCLGRSLKKL